MAESRAAVEAHLPPPPLVTSFAPTHILSTWHVPLPFASPFLTLPFLLPTPEPASPQFLVLSLELLEGFCMAIEGLRKGCHSSHYTTQLPGLNLAPESLQESVRVPANLLNPQVPS